MRSVYGLLIASLFLVGCSGTVSGTVKDRPALCKCYCGYETVWIEEPKPNEKQPTELQVQESI